MLTLDIRYVYNFETYESIESKYILQKIADIKVVVRVCLVWQKMQQWYSTLQAPTALPICSECLGTEAKNKKGVPEKLSACSECGSLIHFSCTTSGTVLSACISKGGKWFCEDCKICDGCGKHIKIN